MKKNKHKSILKPNSSANAKKWEIELATLKSNNMRLTSALQVRSILQVKKKKTNFIEKFFISGVNSQCGRMETPAAPI